MKKLIAIALVALPAFAFASPMGPGPLAADPELQKLRTEIAAAKLDRLLDLSREQSRQLLPLLKEGQSLMSQVQAEHAKRKPQIAAALTQIRDDIRKSGVASEASLSALRQARGQEQLKDVHQQMRALREKVRAIVTPEQAQRLAQFDPRPAGGPEGEDEVGLGGPDGGHGPGRHHAKHGGPMAGKHQRHAVRTALSPEFIALVEARAR